jgi:hypothetical protein
MPYKYLLLANDFFQGGPGYAQLGSTTQTIGDFSLTFSTPGYYMQVKQGSGASVATYGPSALRPYALGPFDALFRENDDSLFYNINNLYTYSGSGYSVRPTGGYDNDVYYYQRSSFVGVFDSLPFYADDAGYFAPPNYAADIVYAKYHALRVFVPDTGKVTVSIASDQPAGVREGNAGDTPIKFTVKLDKPLPAGADLVVRLNPNADPTPAMVAATGPYRNAQLSVDWSLKPGGDVEQTAGAVPGYYVTFKPGQQTKTVYAYASGDMLIEPDERFTLGVSVDSALSSRAAVDASNGVAAGLILNDDGGSHPTTARFVGAGLGGNQFLLERIKADVQAALDRISEKLPLGPEITVEIREETSGGVASCEGTGVTVYEVNRFQTTLQIPKALFKFTFAGTPDPKSDIADVVVKINPAYAKDDYAGGIDYTDLSVGANKSYDITTLMTHEIMHGLGITGSVVGDTKGQNVSGALWGRYLDYISGEGPGIFQIMQRYDYSVDPVDGSIFFDAPRSGTVRLGNAGHVLAKVAKVDPSNDLMSASYAFFGPNREPSDLDISILKDIGWTAQRGTADVVFALKRPTKGAFDDAVYKAKYADVASAGVDARDHYDRWGWKEGRDPNLAFSTKGYLAANGDVRAADVNPLDHYNAHGWHEGRDPGPRFDTNFYLARHADVRAASVNPLEHFLNFGLDEGRASAPAVFDASPQSGFDAGFYLAMNPDVAAAGVDAAEHYRVHGWKEGRDPNAYFSTRAYLALNPDVAAAQANPLEHYELHGWKEHRATGGLLDTEAYLAANPDVAAANENALNHWLAWGINEGRITGSALLG